PPPAAPPSRAHAGIRTRVRLLCARSGLASGKRIEETNDTRSGADTATPISPPGSAHPTRPRGSYRCLTLSDHPDTVRTPTAHVGTSARTARGQRDRGNHVTRRTDVAHDRNRRAHPEQADTAPPPPGRRRGSARASS